MAPSLPPTTSSQRRASSSSASSSISMPPLLQYNPARQARPQKHHRQRILIYLALLLTLSWAAYTITSRSAESSISTAKTTANDSEYGQNARPEFKDMIQLLDLPKDLLPQTGKHRHPNRLIIVGDVHGMKESLVALLAKVDFNEKHDHLILAGDMVSKGPDSAGVVDLAMKLGATGVRGNHEDMIILAHKQMKSEHVEITQADPSENRVKTENVLEEQSVSIGDHKDRVLVKELGEKRIKWLKKCPVILRVGKLGGMGEVVVVHAGLAPGVKLEKQDPAMVMNMRTIGDDGVPSEEREGRGWMKAWNKYQKNLPKGERSTVIYGHNSKRGLQDKKYSMGIDTGCLKGGKLTAVVIEGGHSNPSHKLVHVNCHDGRS